MNNKNREDDHLITRQEVQDLIGIKSATTFYQLRKEPDFPHHIKLGANFVRYWKSDIRRWLETKTQSDPRAST